MALVRNINTPPHGDRLVPLLGLFVAAGDTAEVPDDEVDALVAGDDFEPVDSPAPAAVPQAAPPQTTPAPVSAPANEGQ